MRSRARGVAASAVMAALLVAGKLALSFVPNVEVVTLLVLVFSCAFGLVRTLPAVLVFCLADTLLYGFYPTVALQYFFHYPLLCLGGTLLSRATKNEYAFLGLAALASVFFWIETPAVNALLAFSPFWGTLAAGIPFFLVNLAANCAAVLVLFRPLENILENLSKRLTL